MTPIRSIRDAEELSAYLDNQLPVADLARLETRLASEPPLKEILKDLQEARALLKKTPMQRVPRNFYLTAKMAGVRPPMPRSLPVFRLASVAAAIILFLSFAGNLINPIAAAPSMVQAPLGLGGGCDPSIATNCGERMGAFERGSGFGGGPKENYDIAGPGVLSAASGFLGTPTPEVTDSSGMKTVEQPTEIAAMPVEPVPESQVAADQTKTSQPWVNDLRFMMITLFVVFGVIALVIRQSTIARWQKRS